MKITGRIASAIMATTLPMSCSDAPGRCWPITCEGAGTSTSSSSWKTLYGMSMFTGPGRPVTMVSKPCRSASGSMSTRVGWKARFTTGRTTCGKSALLCL